MTGPAGEDGMDGAQGPRGFNGTDGAQGPRGFNGTDGINGTQGPQGPSGLSTVNSTNLYFREGNINNTSIVATISSTVTCDPGDVIFEGGYANLGHQSISSERADPSSIDPATYSYRVTGDGDGVTIVAFAYCFNNP